MTAEELQEGSIVVFGPEYIKKTQWDGPKVIALVTGYFEYDNGLYTECQTALSYIDPNDKSDPDSVYHLFGNDLENVLDCLFFKGPEEYASHVLQEYRKELEG